VSLRRGFEGGTSLFQPEEYGVLYVIDGGEHLL
jgi:hypothetical protein